MPDGNPALRNIYRRISVNPNLQLKDDGIREEKRGFPDLESGAYLDCQLNAIELLQRLNFHFHIKYTLHRMSL